ncbi:beta-N-acetylhexosaminidase [Novosphingobium sediminicola]|uniref:beta-N-acetylhexosaminidase n=1 Tax=Novosphingobium sediminicola TaxID=563162 RepID=A0A7W6CE43_9SPHN|nr:beta-N-acetylhexosaminidase [Novosphingobium sediminicola]MBB3954854.1 beta-N-acetylhexosaminidase [Novosphingobium sediminicola]
MIPAIFGLSGLTLTDDERAFFRDCDPAGYILFGRNVESRAQLRALTDELRALHGRDDLFISVDQEGGRVARMKPPVWAKYPGGEPFARLYELAPSSAIAAARANAEALGLDLAEAGITVDCWPCVDVREPGAHDVIGDRALGEEPMRVAALGRAILEGLEAAGVAGVIKHMPGHGRAGADSHKELPTVHADVEALGRDIAPFRALAARAKIGMTGHILFPAWDAEAPATQSPRIISEIIRGAIGFDGLLLTDDIDMQALSGTIPERSARALAAGCDLVLNCWARMDDMVGIAQACPTMGEQGAARLARAMAGTFLSPALAQERQAECIATRDALLGLV